MSFVYPKNVELRPVAQALLDKTVMDNPILSRLPIRETPYALVQWERTKSTFGLMQGRGYNNKPQQVPGLGANRFTKTPGVYGEKLPIDELELTTRAQFATFSQPIGIKDLVMARTKQGRTRMYNRMVYHAVTLLTTGRYTCKDAKGVIIDEDTITPQTYAPSVLWSSLATAAPWQDFQNVALLDLGFSLKFDSSATAIMNQKTFNYYRQNQNPLDIYGRKTKFGATYNALGELNQLHQDDGLPNIVIWNESFLDDNGVAGRYMPDGYVIVMGTRTDGEPLGEFLMTKNVNNKDQGSQMYYEVIDNWDGQPRFIEVHLGYNGGIGIYMPEGIIIMKVA